MRTEPTAETEQLYAKGVAFLRAARWDEAVQVFSDLRQISDAYSDMDALIADAMLKIEIERARMPEALAPPAQRRFPLWIAGAVVAAALIAGGGALIALRSDSTPPATLDSTPTPVVVVSNVAPTAVPKPTAAPTPTVVPKPIIAPAPTITAEPTATLETAAAPQSGTIVVRMAEGQKLTRTIGNIEIILDASGSMLAPLDGRRKIDTAHESLDRLIEKLPDTTNVALRSYGHRRTGDCGDIELIVPLAALDRTALTSRISAINPVANGMTPIGLSLQQVADDLKGARGDMVVVLVSDGEETCGSDPAQIAAQLHANNPRLRIDVIGFNIGPEDSRARLSAIAKGGGGSYFDAGDAAQLAAALQQAVALTYRVLDAHGSEVYRGALGSSATLPVGRYSVEISSDAPLTISAVDVGSTKSTTVELHEQGGLLRGAVVP
jgi:Ca-activated chloride channel family protein